MQLEDHTTDKLLLAGVTVLVMFAALYSGNERLLDAFLLSLGAFVKALATRVSPGSVDAAAAKKE